VKFLSDRSLEVVGYVLGKLRLDVPLELLQELSHVPLLPLMDIRCLVHALVTA
jgi:hypothetical protein